MPLVVAHRGSSYVLAEHTLGAYLRALVLALGVDAVITNRPKGVPTRLRG